MGAGEAWHAAWNRAPEARLTASHLQLGQHA
jgi:hypothetical protein